MLPDSVQGQTWKSRLALVRAALSQSRMAMVVSDPRQEDNPLVAVNDAFSHLTGYGGDEVLGRNCRFLQGPRTEREDVQRIKDAVAERRTAYVELLNYRKDGTTFWNALHFGPVYDDDGELIHFFGTQWDVTAKVEALEMLRGRTEITDQRLTDATDEIRHLRERASAAEVTLAAEREALREQLAKAHADRDAWRDQARALTAQVQELSAQGRLWVPWGRSTAGTALNGKKPDDSS